MLRENSITNYIGKDIMYKIKLLLPVLMVLSITGLTSLPTKSEITNNNISALENPIEEVTSISQNVKYNCF
jgi:hypothetical protein